MKSTIKGLYQVKFGYSEKATKFRKIYMVTSNFKWKIFQILWLSQNIRTLLLKNKKNFATLS